MRVAATTISVIHETLLRSSLILVGMTFGAAHVMADQGSKGLMPDGMQELRQCATSAHDLLQRSYEFNGPGPYIPVEIPVSLSRPEISDSKTPGDVSAAASKASLRRAPEGGPIVLRLLRPTSIEPRDWQDANLSGAAQTEERDADGKPVYQVRIQLSVREKDANSIVADALMPDNRNSFVSSRWTIVPVVCSGATNVVIGYSSVTVLCVSVISAWARAIVGMAIFWSGLAVAAWQLNGRRLAELWANSQPWIKTRFPNSPLAKGIWKCLMSADPVFISQDSLGFGSMARFQILMFTSVVGIVLLYIFVHSGVISGMSNTVLLLLGVTVAGGTLGRAAGDWTGISPTSRRWLIGSGILIGQREKPRWSDLFETQGEVDVAKVQALLFTALISISIFASGYTGLSSFALPEQIVYLAIISQGAYLFGKLIPADSRKRLEEDLDSMRRSAANLVTNPNDPQFQQGYTQAKVAAKRTLEQTYLDRFNDSNFDSQTLDPKNVM